ncbi:MAG: hypothetical protein ACRDNF_09875 [Streptosporangiaceae bacterium]
MRGQTRLWLPVFGVSLTAFLIRFLVPVPIGQADNRDGPRLMCGLGVQSLTRGHPRFFRFAYFTYISVKSCAGRRPYPTSEIIPLEVARLLTPVLGLNGTINLIALGVVICALASVGLASLATGLRIKLWARLLIVIVGWLIMADAAFFDVFASPFSEPAALVGLLMVSAGLVYLGRGWRQTVIGLVMAGSGGFLAILAKEQYLVLGAPICLAIVLASADRTSPGRGPQRYRTRQTGAAVAVAAVLAVLDAAYIVWDYTSSYGRRLHQIQAVDMIFQDIVTKHSNAVANLRALGLPAAWARYAGTYYWDRHSVRQSNLLPRYESRLNDFNIMHYLFTHPASIASIGQTAAIQAQRLRVTSLGDYAPSAGHPRGTFESRVVVLTWLAHQLPAHLGLWLYIPLWAAMAAIALVALYRRSGKPWYRDGAVAVLCMTGCALSAFVPPAYFAGISTTRHMVGTNLATALALMLSIGLAASMIYHALPLARRTPAGPSAEAVEPATPEMAEPAP